jgi:hypothetical protein
MPICVSEKMVDAAHRQLPGVANRQRIRYALEAAVAEIPEPGPVELPVTARIRVQVDEGQLLADAQAALDEARRGPNRILWSPFAWDEPHVTEDGLEGPGVTDATGQAEITVNRPQVYAGVSEICAATGAARSTVAGWVKHRLDNGMPEPVAVLAAGPVFDLDAITKWHREWKDAR